jgi:TctA family transporter
MDLFSNLALGFSAALSISNLLYCMLGVTLGTLIGVLPGLGPVATLSMLLPITFVMPPLGALIMLAGIYYGSQYGGSTTAILVNIPGESGSVITCLDGHAMAKEGRAGPALATAAFSSFFAGTVGTVMIALFSPPLSALAVEFHSPEYFSLMVLGLFMATLLSQGSPVKSIGMVLVGLLLGSVGTDVNSGIPRFTFGVEGLLDGIGFVTIAMGMFAISEIIANLQTPSDTELFTKKVGRVMLDLNDLKQSWKAVLRGTGVGAIFGILPGAGTVIASFAAYMVEKRCAADPSRFGKGAIEGVAAPEAANNVAAQTSFIPTLTLGLPGTPTMALVLGAMIVQGIAPGPDVITKYPELFWGLVASMWLGNAMLLVLNVPMIGLWVRLLMVPYRLLCPAIILFCCIGGYSVGTSSFDILLIALFGLFGFLCMKFDCEAAPLLLGFVLGPMLEENMRRALLLSRGDFSVFVREPISLALLAATFLLVLYSIFAALRGRRSLA